MDWTFKDAVINANLFYHKGYTHIKFAQQEEARKSNFKSITRSEQYHSILLSQILLNKTANNMPTGRKTSGTEGNSSPILEYKHNFLHSLHRVHGDQHPLALGGCTPPWHTQAHSTENKIHHTQQGLLHLLTIKQRTNEHVLGKSNFCQPSFRFGISSSLKG